MWIIRKQNECLTEADKSKLNVNGGAMALGHPLGATGIANIFILKLE